MSPTLDDWFEREILVHEEVLVRHLYRVWPVRHEVHDLRQDIYVRVYEAAARARPASPRSFLFATARNILIDRLRRGRIVSIEAVGDFESLELLVDELSPERRFSARQELKRLAEAFDLLPDRCREIVWLRRVEELPQRDVAARMGISEKTVEKQFSKGVRRIADLLFGEERSVSMGSGHRASKRRGGERGQQP